MNFYDLEVRVLRTSKVTWPWAAQGGFAETEKRRGRRVKTETRNDLTRQCYLLK
jgi:hypothetical protein